MDSKGSACIQEMRGISYDLATTLTASLLDLDYALMLASFDSEEYDQIYLAALQLGRALEFFLEIRSLLLISDNSGKRPYNKGKCPHIAKYVPAKNAKKGKKSVTTWIKTKNFLSSLIRPFTRWFTIK